MRFLLSWLAALFFLASAHAEEPRKQLKVLTYNILASTAQWNERIPALLKILEFSNADIIALQEVTSDFSKVLAEQKWAQTYYTEAGQGKFPPAHEYLILSRTPILSHTLQQIPGPQQRRLFLIRTLVNNRVLAVATCHLESLLDDGPRRAQQLDLYFKELRGAQDYIFLGDFNFGDREQPETGKLDRSFLDVWPVLHPGNAGYTWNIELSPMAKSGSFPHESSRRLDRILLKSDVWKPKEATILGHTPVSPATPNVFPSDHFGLEAIFTFETEKKTD